MKRATAALVVALAACKSTPSLESDAPEDLTFLVVVELDDDGRPRAAGPLGRWAPNEPIDVIANGPALLVGYDDETLAAAGLLEQARNVGAAPLRLAQGCDSTLPTATWLASWDDGVASRDPIDTPRLTAFWIQETCPDFSPNVGFDDDCRAQRCDPTIDRIGTCRVVLDVASCDLGRTEVTIGPLGQVCATFAALDECTVTSTAPGFGVMDCAAPRCTVDVHAQLDDALPPMNVELVTLFDVPLAQPGRIPESRQPFRHHFYEGYVHDLVVLDDRVVLVAPVDGRSRARCESQSPQDLTPARELLFLDPDTLQIVDRTPTDECMIAPIRDPMGDGFLATYVADRIALARYDKDGVRTASVSFAEGELAGVVETSVHEMHIIDGDTIVVVTNAGDAEIRWSGFRTFDLATLAPKGVYFIDERGDEFAVMDEPGHVLVLNQPGRTWTRVNLSDGARRQVIALPEDDRLQSTLLAAHGQRGLAIAAGRGHKALNALEPTLAELSQASTFQEELHVFRMAAWPADDRYVLVGGGLFEEAYGGGVVLFDLETMKFVPGIARLGEGAVIALRPDGRGGVLALMPWKAQIARITPRGR